MITGQLTGQVQFESSRVYHDLNSLNLLKEKKDSPETIREAAKQFESIFMGMMLKSMRDANDAIIDEPMLNSAQLGMYQDMYDEQLTLHLGSTSGLGLTEVLVQQLTGQQTKAAESNTGPTEFNPRRVESADYSLTNVAKSSDILAVIQSSKSITASDVPEEQQTDPLVIQKVDLEAVEAEASKQQNRGIDFSSPVAFVGSLLPYAQQAAKALNLDPKLLLAQAALETGWGKFIMRNETGESSKNLFGIKATSSWQGESISVKSLEVENGQVVSKQSSFRSYESYEDSFNDYAQFINTKQRYQEAVKVSSKPEQYTQELQVAGYATDPDYASKINEIYNSSTLNKAMLMFEQMP